MKDGSFVLAPHPEVDVLNGIGLLMTWMKNHSRTYESLFFASEVLGALHREEEDCSPPELAA
jgi:hypothetical protein